MGPREEGAATTHTKSDTGPPPAATKGRPRTFRVWRGDASGGKFVDYQVPIEPGMVVLDAIHRIQATEANDLAVRWNCKAGKCGSCSCEINGKPKLSCMTRVNDYGPDETITVQPIKTFPIIKDLVTDVSWNYQQNKKITPFTPRQPDADGNYRMMQEDVDRIQEFRKCIECYLCQDVCHVLRDHDKKDKFVGPRFMIRLAHARDAPARHRRSHPADPHAVRLGHVQHQQVLHRRVPGAHQHHGQRDHPAQGAGGGSLLRSVDLVEAQDPRLSQG